jgi:glycosidase
MAYNLEMKRFISGFVMLLLVFALGADFSAARAPTTSENAWYANAVFYEIFVRSFQDSGNDGIGDFKGLTSRLDDLKALGVNALWLMPINPSPSYHGYDVTDYKNINPQYGTLADFDAFMKTAHEKGFKVILDWVSNHTSSLHPWFLESQDPNSAKRNWYQWRDTDPGWGQPWDGNGKSWHSLPNKQTSSNLKVIFPGTIQGALGAKNWNPDGQETRALEVSPGVFELVVLLPKGSYEFKVALNGSWSENYGADAKRDGANIKLEVANDNTIVKFVYNSSSHQITDSINNPDLVQAPSSVPPRPTFNDAPSASSSSYFYGAFWEGMPDLNWRNPEVKAAMNDGAKFWLERGVDGFRIDAMRYMVEGENDNKPDSAETLTWTRDFSSFVRGINPDAAIVGEVWTDTETVAKYFQNGAGEQMGFNFPMQKAIAASVNGSSNEAINFELARVAKAYSAEAVDAIFTTNHDLDRPFYFGAGRYRVAAGLLLTLPGTPFLYYGDEIGMKNGPQGGDEAKRTPMRWDLSDGAGFSSTDPWTGFSTLGEKINVKTQRETKGSLWNFYANMIKIRQSKTALRVGGFEPLTTDKRIMAFIRYVNDQAVVVVINLDSDPQKLKLNFTGTRLEKARGTVRELTLNKTLATLTDSNISGYELKLISNGLVLLEVQAQ